MIQAQFKEGIPTCRCGSQEFNVIFRELVAHKLNAAFGQEGWGESDALELESRDPIEAIECQECKEDIELMPELVKFIRKIE